jgi:cell division protein FtsB
MRVAIAFGVCLLLFGLFGDEHGLRAMLQARRDARALADRVVSLRAENAMLRQRAEQLRRDPHTIEVVARETLGLVAPGELVVVRSR